MKIYSSSHHFEYPWDQVTAANWVKYPNEMSTHVVAVDVLRRELDKENKILRTERLITCKQSIPKWLSMMVGCQNLSYVREVSEIDLNSKTLTMRSNNLTMNHLLSVYETVTYIPDPENPKLRTLFKQEAEITAYGSITRLCDKVEEWSVQRFNQNAIKGKAGFESVLKLLSQQWNKSEEFVVDVSNSLIQDLNEVSEKTQGVLSEVSEKVKGGVFKNDS